MIDLNAQVSSFNIVYQTGGPPCGSGAVTFQNNSTGSITGYAWTFAGGIPASSNSQNPGAVFFNTCGTHAVTLTVSGPGGNNATTQNVTVWCNPTACFTITPHLGCSPINATFNTSCTQAGGAGYSISSYQWDFGDATTSGAANPTHQYVSSIPFCYSVGLIVTNNHGCTSFLQKIDSVCIIQPPVPVITPATPYSSCSLPYTTVPPISGSSSSTAAPPLTYSWTFAGGTPATSTSVSNSVTFNTAGGHNVSLTVTDATGCSASTSISNYVNLNSNSTNFTVSPGTTICSGGTVTCSSSSAGIAYTWSVSPNTGVTISAPNAISTGITFNTAGPYTITLNQTFPGNCVASHSTPVTVNQSPVANFSMTGTAAACAPPLSLTFTNTSTSVVAPATYSWSFPGGSPLLSSNQNPGVINFTSCGQFTPTLTVTNSNGCANSHVGNTQININCPNATFGSDTTQGCVPLLVHFGDSSLNGPWNHQWFFYLNGTPCPAVPSSTLANPTYTFNIPGCYDVRLIIISPSNSACRDTLTQQSMICVGQMVNACFTATPLISCASQPVVFTNCSTPFPFPTGTTICWNPGSIPTNLYSCVASTPNLNFLYQDTGVFTVTLIMSNYGCHDTLQVDSMITIVPPVAHYLFHYDCANPSCVTFDGDSLSIGAAQYQWSFPGGAVPATSTSANPVACWAATGNYNVSLTVTDSSGNCTDIETRQIRIRHLNAHISALPNSGCAPFIPLIFDSTVDASSWQWYIYPTGGPAGQSVASTQYLNTVSQPGNWLFTTPGDYNVMLVATDDNGCKDTSTIVIHVYGVNVGFSSNPNPANGCAPFNVSFINQSSNSSTSVPLSYVWDFGDPCAASGTNTSNLVNPNHLYTCSGCFTVSLIAIDNHGCQTAINQSNFVCLANPTVDFYAVDSTICAGDSACFFNLSFGNSLSYHWIFGDPTTTGDTSDQFQDCYAYINAGTYGVQLTVTDTSSGCYASLTRPNYIHVFDPQANFTANNTVTSCPPMAVNFTNTSTSVSPGTVYLWNFGDNPYYYNVPPPGNAFHIYTYAGNFSPTLILLDPNGCNDTITIPNYIQIGGPTATVTVTPDTGCVPTQVCFNANPTNSISFVWDFGDGTILNTGSTAQTCHTYINSGIYAGSVLLSDGVSCSYPFYLDTVVIVQPVPLYSASTYDLCGGGTVQFSDSSTAEEPITSWTWNFGGLGNSALQNPSFTFSTVGSYIVTLTITTLHGCTATYQDTINVTVAPTSNFTWLPINICPNTVVNFTDQSTSASPIVDWFWNFGNPLVTNDTSHAMNPSYSYAVGSTYNVTLITTATNGCQNTVTIPVLVHPYPAANAGPDLSICIGDSIQLNATGGVTYLWSPSTALSSTTISNPFANPVSNITYIVSVTDQYGCQANDTLGVTVNSLPIANAGNDAIICFGSSTQLQATGGTSYSWQPTTGLNNPNISNPIATLNATTTYVVNVINGNNCFRTDTVVVFVLSQTPANAGTDQEICFGDSIQLLATGGVSYSWSPAAGLSNPNIANPYASPITTTTYSVVVTDSNNCTGTASIIVKVDPLPIVSAGADQNICEGTTALLQATGGVGYLWSPNLYLNNNTLSNPICTPPDSVSYVVTVTDTNGCINHDTVNVNVIFPFTAIFTGDTTVCAGDSVMLSAFTPTAQFWHWSPATGLSNPNVGTPLASPSVNTTYTVVVSDGLCFADTGIISVTVYPLPFVYAGVDEVILAGEPVSLSAQGNPANGIYTWQPTYGLSCSNCPNPNALPDSTTVYIVTITDQNGCKFSDSLTVFVYCNDDVMFIPNAFSPNNDGKNDVFKVRAVGLKKLNFLRIYDRWGSVIFETTDLSIGWDGTSNGKAAEAGVYIYDMEAFCSNGTLVSKHGNVTLIK